VLLVARGSSISQVKDLDNMVVTSTEKGVGGTHTHALVQMALVCANLLWVGGTVASKHILSKVPYLAYAQIRVSAGALCFAVFYFAWRRRPRLDWRTLDWKSLTVLAVTGASLNHLLFFAGLKRTSVVHTGLIISLGPVMVLTMACLLRLEELTVLKFVGMLVSFGGVAALTMRVSGVGNGGQLAGDLLVLLTTLVSAFYAIQLKKVSDQHDAVTLNMLTFGLGSLFMLPFSAPGLLHLPWAAIPGRVWWMVAYVVFFGTFVGYLIFVAAMVKLPVSRVQAFGYLQPVFGTLLAIGFLSERLSARVVVGGTVILLGVYLSERNGEPRRRKSHPSRLLKNLSPVPVAVTCQADKPLNPKCRAEARRYE
jgi:drug/metabolite transporter (DMT)-like permease